MSSQPGPPGPPFGQPPSLPYGSSPYGPPPRRGGRSGTLLAALLAVAFVAATAIVAFVVHHPGKDSRPTAQGVPLSGAPSTRTNGLGFSLSNGATPSFTPPTYTPPTYTPPSYTPAPTPTHVPLDPAAINRTFEVYMNALAYHSLSSLKTATCPRLRRTETGTALHGKYVGRWKGNEYTIYNDLDYVRLSAFIHLINPSTGNAAGTVTYSWYVEREPNGAYYVCGFLS